MSKEDDKEHNHQGWGDGHYQQPGYHPHYGYAHHQPHHFGPGFAPGYPPHGGHPHPGAVPPGYGPAPGYYHPHGFAHPGYGPHHGYHPSHYPGANPFYQPHPDQGYGAGQGQGYGYSYGQGGYGAGQQGWLQGLLNAPHSQQFLMGLAVGAGAAWVLSDEETREKLMRAGVNLYSNLTGGVEELKEQLADIQAELDAERHKNQ
ncbi:YtxH domain-containing protein [Halorhodospira halochloris]|uniref:YtxH domain-containing protein n=1 Tax=Halorhodospira halochloris TaxID=1052 RepID=UPI0013A5B2D2|nr:YtxH domain-containing protein [Halorhodospira halochloris]